MVLEGSGTFRLFIIAIAAFATILVLFGNPRATHALSLFWGDENGGSPTQVEITDGGAFSVPLNTGGQAYISPAFIGLTPVQGIIYRIDASGGVPVRVQLQTVHGQNPNGDPLFAWPSAGSYEMDAVATAPPPILGLRDRVIKLFAHLFLADIAHAQVLPPPPSGPPLATIHFTIQDAAAGCTQNCFSNVLFLPGIESSRLYRPDYNGGTDKLWEPNANADVQDLFMTPQGESARFDVYTKEGDVLDEEPDGVNVYKSFMAKMNDLKSQGLINDWEAAPYDWRLSLDDILQYGNDVDGHLYYSGDLRATSTPYIIQELRKLAATSKSGKVTIIAHSNGGLVAKRLTEVLGNQASDLIDKMIFVAVPQAGTPMAVAAGLHGYDQALLHGLILSQSTARTFASTSPMFYNLLPSAQYFTYVDDPIITFDPSLTTWVSKYGSIIHSGSGLRQFVTDNFGRVDAQTGDTDQPIQLNSGLLTNAESLHSDLDNWAPPSGVQLIQIAGWGVPNTVTGINYIKKGAGVKPEPNFTIDGDGTVVVPSALWTSGAGSSNYFVDLQRYNKDNGFSSGFGFAPFNHARILEAQQLLSLLSDNLTSSLHPLSDYIYVSATTPPSTGTRLRFALHSPLTLNLYDNFGHHTGISTTTGEIEEGVPGSYYTEFGDTKYIFSDGSDPSHIVLDGYGSGTFTLNVDQYRGDGKTASTTFQDIPTTPDTIVTLDTQSDVTTLSSMHVDANGDGKNDFTLPPKLGGIVTLDTTPPEASITISTSMKDLAITGIDDSTPVSVIKSANSATLTDAAGNVTSLAFQKVYTSKLLTAAKMTGIKYGSNAMAPLSSSLLYIWDAKQNLVSQTVTVDSQTIVQALFDPKKNKTTIIVLKKRKIYQSLSLNGMVLVKLTTNKGSVNYGW